ncbi:enoyl-CoA hydratase [Rhodobacterales bacterium HKCCD6035]|nr:enoyl-CoA hydratase [Rhodobacterales bacterium HKCCD6035]
MTIASQTNILDSALDARGILRLTLNDEKRRNALSEAMLNRLFEAIHAAGDDPEVRVVILASRGPAFCAGHDLKELTAARAEGDGGRAYFTKIMALCASVMQAIVACPKPVIAEVRGVATAAGCQLVATCDLAVAEDGARFGTPGVHIGLFCSTPMVALSRNVSHKHAMEMLLTGDMIAAPHAVEMGLVNKAVPEAELSATTEEMAAKIAAKSTMTLAIGKSAFYRQAEMGLAEAYNYAAQVMVDNMLTHDAEEGIGAFIEKRHPQWQDK